MNGARHPHRRKWVHPPWFLHLLLATLLIAACTPSTVTVIRENTTIIREVPVIQDVATACPVISCPVIECPACELHYTPIAWQDVCETAFTSFIGTDDWQVNSQLVDRLDTCAALLEEAQNDEN